MKKREILFLLFISTLITFTFFYKVFLFKQVPIPGDLLISECNPWRAYSYLGYNPGSYPSKVQYFDVIKQLYPWRSFAIDMFKNFELPLWNPYNFSGSPLLGNSQSSVFYPLNILFLFFSKITAWSILVVIQPFLLQIFTYLYSREIGISKKGAFLASIAFSFSLFVTVFLEYNTVIQTIIWLPLSLYLVEKIIQKITFKRLILFALSLVFSCFAGHLQVFGFSFMFILVYILFRIFSQPWKASMKIIFLVNFTLLILLSFGIAAIQIIPTFELINNSARGFQDYQFLIKNLLIQPSQLILFLSPDFFGNPATKNYLLSDSYPGNALYIGLIPFIFSIFAIINFKKNNLLIKFFSLISLSLIILFVRTPFTELFYSLNIPFFSTGSPTNAIFLLSLSLSLLAGFGLDEFINKQKRNFILTIGFIFGAFILTWFFIIIFHPAVSIKNFIYSSIILSAFLFILVIFNIFKNKRYFALILLFLLTTVDLFYFFHKFNPFVPSSIIFPNAEVFHYLQKNGGINRFWGYGSAAVEANLALSSQPFSPDGYDPLYPKRYGEFIGLTNDGKIRSGFNNGNRSDATITSGYGENDLTNNVYRLKVLDLLGVKYILDKKENNSTEKTFPHNKFKLVYSKNEWQIFENLKSVPRFFLTSDYEIFRNNKEFESKFFNAHFDPSRKVLLEEKINFSPAKNNYVEVNLLKYSPNEIIFRTKADAEKLLFLSDVFYPGWIASVDNKNSKIYRTNYAFKSIIVPKGAHTVIFKYQPSSFYLGFNMSIISIISLLAFTLLMVKNKKRIYEE